MFFEHFHHIFENRNELSNKSNEKQYTKKHLELELMFVIKVYMFVNNYDNGFRNIGDY